MHGLCAAGSDIMEGNKTLTLALVWQLMRAYTLALLSQLNQDSTPIVESEIIAWANNKLQDKGVTIRHFQDKVNNQHKHFLLSDSLSLRCRRTRQRCRSST